MKEIDKTFINALSDVLGFDIANQEKCTYNSCCGGCDILSSVRRSWIWKYILLNIISIKIGVMKLIFSFSQVQKKREKFIRKQYESDKKVLSEEGYVIIDYNELDYYSINKLEL